jgi:hypothetical protein
MGSRLAAINCHVCHFIGCAQARAGCETLAWPQGLAATAYGNF